MVVRFRRVSFRQPDMTERLICSRLDVPVIPEHVEMVVCDVVALDRVQRGDLLGDAGKVRDHRIDSKGERLLEVIDVARRICDLLSRSVPQR